MSKSIVSNTPETATDLVNHDIGFNPWRPYPVQTSTGLHSFISNPPEFAGGFLLETTGDATAPSGLGNAVLSAMCVGESGRLFVTGQDSGEGGLRRFAEFEMPAVVAGTDMSARNVGARVQGYRNLATDFNLSSYGTDEQTAVIHGMYYDPSTGRLHVGACKYYDGAYSGQFNHYIYNDASDLSAGVTGPLLISAAGDGATNQSAGFWGGQIIPLPAKWHTVFGGTHLVHNGRRIAIASRASIGPSAGVVTPSSIGSGGGVENTLMRYTTTHPLAAWEDSSSGSLVYLTNQIWNHLSHCAFAFVIPNTDTLCYVGHNLDKRLDSRGNNTIHYKALNSEGSYADNDYAPYWADGHTGCYWLFDLNDLANTIADPVTYPAYSHQPYEHGYIDIPAMAGNWRRNVWGGCFNPHTNQMIFALTRGAEPRYTNSVCSFEVFNLPGVTI